ncbi:unnamed protein product [Porites lobata]|uniref:Uncharacterized protein n=1 Tax=Porites lobata TaxID=104759 RepID=A0ABN8QUW9_9CNID|nr:unnamed protein product [Porites lobata]
MLKMNKRGKDVNWSKLANASPKPKRLHLEEDDCDGLFHCPQIVSRCLKFLKFCCEDEEELTFGIVDFSLCSPNLLFKFVDTMQDEWKLGHAGRIGYLDAIAKLADFRKVNGASETVWRGLSTAEMYLKRARKTVSKMMRLQWTSELDIDALEAKGHWATMEELLEVVGRYLPRYESVLKTCRVKPDTVSPLELSFATKFLAVYLFIKVKGSRPMTYQYLTVEMVDKAKTNGGFIDQKQFKTAGKYYVLVTRNGRQHNKLGEAMSKLVFDATGKYVHPTRYRQIVETASSRTLSSSAQDAISEDQKHSSVVARVHYQKRRSREIACKAHAFLERLQGERGSEQEMDVRSRPSENSNSSQEQDVRYPLVGVPKLRRENAFRVTDTSTRRKSLMFTPVEDKFLKAGLKRHGFGQWKAILTDPDFQFQKGRTANSPLSRAARRFGSYSKSTQR